MLRHNTLVFVLGTHYSKNGNKHKMTDLSHRIQGLAGGWNLDLHGNKDPNVVRIHSLPFQLFLPSFFSQAEV